MSTKSNNLKDLKNPDISYVREMDGISNLAIDVASVVQFHSVFAQQNKRYASIDIQKIFYQEYLFLKSLLTEMSRKIMSRRHSGFSRKMQRALRKQVLICRFLGLLPYVK